MTRDLAKKREWQRKWRLNHLEHAREINRKSYRKHRKTRLEKLKKWQASHPNYNKMYAFKLKLAVLSYYSDGNKPKCVRCGFEDVRALTIDHINGNGNKLRKVSGQSSFYMWLRKHNYPEGYQCLCMNCQFIKRFENGENS